MNSTEFNAFRVSVERDLTLSRDNAQEMVQKSSNLSLRYLDVYITEKAKLKGLISTREHTYAERYKHYKFHGDYKIEYKTEVDIFVKGDDEYRTIAKRCDAQEIVVEFCSEAYSRASKLTYNTKQYLEYEQLKLGVVR
jgi:hypothetical protein